MSRISHPGEISARAARRKAAREFGPATTPRNPRLKLKLALAPWKIDLVWRPLEQIMTRMEMDGTTESAQGRPIYYDAASGEWHEIAPAVRGIVDFHRIAAARHGWSIDPRPLEKLATKLDHGSPIFPADLEAVRATATTLRRLVAQLTIGEAEDILTSVRIQAELEQQP